MIDHRTEIPRGHNPLCPEGREVPYSNYQESLISIPNRSKAHKMLLVECLTIDRTVQGGHTL